MKTKKVSTWLPVFTGFYESIFDPTDNYLESETNLSLDEYKDYYETLFRAGVSQEFFNENLCMYLNCVKGLEGAAEYICNSLACLDSADIIIDTVWESLQSPKYYNFSTDSINCEIEYNADLLAKYLKENEKELIEYLKGKYTSRDGFSSSYTSDLGYWIDPENHGAHEVGSLLQFVLENENDDPVIDLYYASDFLDGFIDSVEFDENGLIAAYADEANN